MALSRTGPVRADLRKWNGVALPAGGFSVRAGSVQQGSITVNGATAVNGAISSVNTSGTKVSYNGCDSDSDTVEALCTVELADATTVTARRQTSGPGTNARVRFATNDLR